MYNGGQRSDHPTLSNEDLPKLYGIQLKFMSLNKNCVYNEMLALRQKFNSYITLPLTNENIKIPNEFGEALRAAMANMPDKELPSPNEPTLLGLIKVVQNNSKAFS